MAKLIYSAITSLDGYVADEHGNFDWAAPDEEVHSFVNDLERPIGTYLYGRRMYETMLYWETAQAIPDHHTRALGAQCKPRTWYVRVTCDRPSATAGRTSQWASARRS